MNNDSHFDTFLTYTYNTINRAFKAGELSVNIDTQRYPEFHKKLKLKLRLAGYVIEDQGSYLEVKASCISFVQVEDIEKHTANLRNDSFIKWQNFIMRRLDECFLNGVTKLMVSIPDSVNLYAANDLMNHFKRLGYHCHMDRQNSLILRWDIHE